MLDDAAVNQKNNTSKKYAKCQKMSVAEEQRQQ